MAHYVTIKRGSKVGFLAGPFNRHGDALAQVDPCRAVAYELDPDTHWDAFGTTRTARGRAKVGVLNDRLGLTAEDLEGAS